MTPESTLRQVIEKAVKNGFRWLEFFSQENLNMKGTIEEVAYITYISRLTDLVIFSHEFAKCFWVDRTVTETYDLQPHETLTRKGVSAVKGKKGIKRQRVLKGRWKYHLQQLALSEDRLAYLATFLP